MLTFFLDKENRVPLYEQLYQAIKESIIANELKKDEKLPSKRKLAQHLKISIITVENAYQQLTAEGYIKSKPKSGFYVLPYVELKPSKYTMKPSLAEKQTKKKSYRFDLRTNLVDTQSFPFDKLAKIERDMMQYDYKDHMNQVSHLGYQGLREQIAHLLFEYRGIIAKPETIVIGSGSENLISLLVLLLGRHKIYGVEEPGYLKNYKLYQAYGASAKTFDIDEEGIDISSIEDINVVHVTPSHQFPLGVITSISRRMKLLNWVNENDNRYIIEDDYDSEFRFSGKPIPALKSLDDRDKVIYLNSFSKSISPSIRVSFMVLPDHLINQFNEQFHYLNCSVPMQTQLVLEAFIKSREYEKHLARTRNMYKLKRDYLIECIDKTTFNHKITIKAADSGLHFLMEVNTTLDIETLVKKADDYDIKLYSINDYYLNKVSTKKSIVIGYAHLTHNQIESMTKLLEQAWSNI